MVKIKRKVEMTLPKLIEWGLENGIKSKRFASNRLNTKYVGFDSLGGVCFNGLYSYLQQDTFTVEVEEEITGETILPEVVVFYVDGDGTQYSQRSINELKDSLSKEFWLKDGDTMTLIWKDGELVGDE